MDKLFFPGFFLLCFLWVPGHGRKLQKMNVIMCNYCKIFKYGTCVDGLKTCFMEKESGCRSQVFYKKTNNGNEYSHTQLDCYKECKDKRALNDEQPAWTLCCQGNKCNLPFKFA